MKSRSRFIATLILVSTLFSNSNSMAAGRSASAVVNTILNGKGAPKSSIGIDGDFYIDTRSLLLYGPKTKGKWPTPQSIQGPTGPAGNDGRNGNDGKAVATNVSAVTGPQGPVGPQGEKGDKGDPGPAGPSGASGSTGPAGPTGAAGANGSNGLQGPAGATGPQGPIGLTGAQGATGATGPTGAQGATGPVGPKGETGTAGISEVAVVDIPEFVLGTSIPFTFGASGTFASLKANSSYKFDLFLRATSNSIGLVLGLDVLAAGGSLEFTYIRTDGRLASFTSAPPSYGFMVTGTIQLGNSDSALLVRIVDAYGETAASPLTFSGKAYITPVGVIR